jgi:hypothetical protein
MKRKVTFRKAYHVLTCAYMAGTLLRGSCYSSAAGCIVQYKKIAELTSRFGAKALIPALKKKASAGQRAQWAVMRSLSTEWHHQIKEYRSGRGANVKLSGYSIKELSEIEHAFNSYADKNDKDGFYGLCAVYNALCKIHKVKGAVRLKHAR